MKRLGERIKKKRESQQLHLGDLAKKVGVSASALSQIENAKAFPSIVTLKSIADNLHTTVGELIGENEALSQNPLITIIERRFVEENKSGTKLYLLSHHDSQKQMETYLLQFKNGSDANYFFPEHNGQTFIYVQSGSFIFTLNNDEYRVEAGDSFFFHSILPFSAQLTSGSELGEMIWVVTPAHG